MKRRILTIITPILLMCLICGCGNGAASSQESTSEAATSEAMPAEESVEATTVEEAAEEIEEAAEVVEEVPSGAIDFDLLGTRWKRDGFDMYLYFATADSVNKEFISTSTSTTTINGSTSTHTSKSKREESHTWSQDGNNIVIDEKEKLELIEEDGTYKLSGSGGAYILTDEDPLADSSEEAEVAAALEAEPYTINDTIATDTIEMILTENGVAEDIRITSNESGINITSGPAPESGKKFIYAKGKVKNLDKTTINTNMTGTFVIDGYSFDMRVHTVDSAGNPLSMIEPLEEMTIILYAAVSNDLIDNYSEAVLTFGFNDSFNMLRSLSDAEHTYMVNL